MRHAAFVCGGSIAHEARLRLLRLCDRYVVGQLRHAAFVCGGSIVYYLPEVAQGLRVRLRWLLRLLRLLRLCDRYVVAVVHGFSAIEGKVVTLDGS